MTKQSRIKRACLWVASLTLAMTIWGGMPNAASAQDITSGLVAHWQLDEETGTSLLDSSVNDSHGTWTGSADVNPVEGVFSRAMSFNGTSEYINIADSDALDFGSGDFTFSAWVKIPTTNNCGGMGVGRVIFGQRNGGTAPTAFLACDSTMRGLRFYVADSNSNTFQAVGTTALNDGQWHHVVGVKSGHATGTIAVYVDGALQQSIPTAFTGHFTYTAPTPTSIGRYNVGPFYYLESEIDDVRVYSRALTAPDVAALYEFRGCANPHGNKGTLFFNNDNNVMQYCNGTQWRGIGQENIPSNGLIGHWKLDEESGNIIYDSSGNDNHGTIINPGNAIYGMDGVISNTIGSTVTGNTPTSTRFEVSGVFPTGVNPPFTVAMWVKRTAQVESIFKNANGASVPDIQLHRSYRATYSSSFEDFSVPFVADEWEHIGLTYDGTDISFYQNGVFIDGNTKALTISNSDFRLGYAGTAYGNGGALFDDVRLYNRALSEDELERLYNAGIAVQTAPLTLVDTYEAATRSGFSIDDGTYIYNSDTNNLYAYQLVNGTITRVGNGYDNPGLLQNMVYDGTYIHGRTRFPHRLFAVSFNGSDFTQTATIALPNDPSGLATDGTYFYVVDAVSGLQAYSFNGTSYTLRDTWPDVTNLRTVYTHNGYIFAGEGEDIYVLDYDGNDFTLLDSFTCVDGQCGGNPLMAFKDNYIFVAHNSTGRRVHVFTFDGTTLTEIHTNTTMGSSFASGNPVFINNHFFVPASDGRTYVFKFNGTSLDMVEYIEDSSESYVQLYTDGSALYRGSDSEGLKVYSGYGMNLGLVLSFCKSPVEPSGTILFNTDHNVMQYCNGAEWVAFSPPNDGGGGGCNNPSGLQAELRYNNNYNVLQYCEGNEWVAVGGIDVEQGIASGLIAHWKLDETEDADIADASGNGYNGTWIDNVNNDVTEESVAGIDGTAIRFDGTNDVIDVGDVLDLTESLTICAWARPESFTTGYIAGKFSAGSSQGYFLRANTSSSWTMGTDSVEFVRVENTLVNDTWQHICAVYNPSPGTSGLYKDGVMIGSNTTLVAHEDNAIPLTIGNRHDNNRRFRGAIDDLRIYDHALTPAEIQALYNSY